MSAPKPLRSAPPAGKEEQPPSPIAKAAKWGALVGFIVAQLVIRRNSPLGFYGGETNMLLVFAICIGLGTAIGAGFAWLSLQSSEEDEPFRR